MAKPQTKMGSTIANYHQGVFSASAMLSPHATICGNVTIGEEASVFAGTQIRGDCAPIAIGGKTNIQENACLHVSVGSKLTVGNHVTVGHGTILHGCTIGDNVLVGMGSIVMDDAVIGENCLIAAGSLITQGKQFEPGMLIMGSPARAVRELAEAEIETMITAATDAYVGVARSMLADGLMKNPPMGATVWPVQSAMGDAATGGMMFGALF